MRTAILLLATAALLSSAARAEIIHIDVKGLGFAPADASAHVGDTIEWKNEDFVAHTATARGNEFDVRLAPKATGRAVIKGAGKIEYYCRYHPNMKGTITVGQQ